MIILHFSGNKDMMVLVTYDINTGDKFGQKRLNKVAKLCEDKGRRVQNSVFECILDNAEFTALKLALMSVINEKYDSIRFYNLGNNYKSRVEHYGVAHGVAADDILIF